MDVKEIVVEWLEKNGYDGLYCAGECACDLEDIFPVTRRGSSRARRAGKKSVTVEITTGTLGGKNRRGETINKEEQAMQITKDTSSYNQRRMGQPWIAKVDFATAKGEFAWGDWTGDQYNGGKGVLSIDAVPGDIIATGQKDHRQPKNSAPDFFVVTADGTLDSLGDKGAAYKYYLTNKPTAIALDEGNPLAKISNTDLIAEVIRRGLNVQQAA